MTRSQARRFCFALTSVLLLAQLLLAWHIPSHLHDHQHDVFTSLTADQPVGDQQPQSNEPCSLSINGHGVALTCALQTCCSDTPSQQPFAYWQTTYRSLYSLSYQARGPPLHS